MHPFDSFELARAQIALDRERTAHMPTLFEHKVERMCTSSVGCLRGAAPLYYATLAAHHDLADGPAGEGWIVGDLHVENFGVYRPSPLDPRVHTPSTEVALDINDFDDTVIGPWRLDVMRLVTSLVLAVRGRGASGERTVTLANAMLDAYVESAFGEHGPGTPPKPVASLLQTLKSRSRTELLDARTKKSHGGRRFLRDGKRYVDLPHATDVAAREAFAEYARKMKKAHGIDADHFEVLDTAFRVAGTGSLGTLRIAVLVSGKGGEDGSWVFDMKAQGKPSAAALLKVPEQVPAERVIAGMHALLEHPLHMVSAVRMGSESMFVRRLTPQEDKLDISRVHEHDLESTVRYLGSLTGAAHRRAVVGTPPRAWSQADCAALLNRALALAGMHESIYLAYAWLTHAGK